MSKKKKNSNPVYNIFSSRRESFRSFVANSLKEDLEEVVQLKAGKNGGVLLAKQIIANCSRKGELSIEVVALVDFGLVGSRMTISKKSAVSPSARSDDELVKFIMQEYKSLISKVLDQFKQNIPTSKEEAVHYNPVYHPLHLAPNHFLSCKSIEYWVEAYETACNRYCFECAQKTIDELVQKNADSYKGGVPIRLVACNVRLSTSREMSFQMRANMTFAFFNAHFGTQITKEITVDTESMLSDSATITQMFERKVMAAMKSGIEKAFEKRSLFVMDCPGLAEEIRDSLLWIFHSNRTVQGISNRYKIPYFKECYLTMNPTTLLLGDYLYSRHTAPIDLDAYKNSQEHPYHLSEQRGPQNIFEFVQFIAAANEIFPRKMKQEGFKDFRPIKFVFDNNDRIIEWRYQGKQTEVHEEDFLGSADAFLTKVIDTVLSDKKSQREKAMEIIKELDAKHLDSRKVAIIKQIAKQRTGSRTNILNNTHFIDSPSNPAKDRAFEKVVDIKITVNGKEVPIITQSMVYWERKDIDYTRYEAQPFLTEEVASFLEPCSLLDRPFEELNTKEKMDYIQQKAAKAKIDDELWSVFQLLEQVPKTHMTAFVKSPAGTAFLSKFKGGDAIYVKFAVEKLPGCARLAEKIGAEE